jgi:excisionase family DNA binding protein
MARSGCHPHNGSVARVTDTEGHDVRGNGHAAGADERLLTPAEVAALFPVDPKTVTRWAKAGKLSSIRTLGGHRRYWEAEVRRLLDQSAIA